MVEEHLPGCAALRCRFNYAEGGRVIERLTCEEEKHRHEENGPLYGDHLYQPGPCDCLLGEQRKEIERLRAEVGRLDKEFRKAWDRAERGELKITTLRDWQRRAYPKVNRLLHLALLDKVSMDDASIEDMKALLAEAKQEKP